MSKKSNNKQVSAIRESQIESHHFEFDLDRAIREQVIAKLNELPLLNLEKSIAPQLSGIYALYFRKKLVYVGKASKGTTQSGRTLRARLNEHLGKISGRQNIRLDEVKCKFLTFDTEWWVFAAEFVLIASMKPEWNYSGFGSKVPGKGRPGTERVSVWDTQFPYRPS